MTALPRDGGAAAAPIRARIRDLETQQILQVSELALGDPKVIPLWYGESDVATPDFINRAAAEALAAGHTFYTYKQGIPELRAALADYARGLYGVAMPAERITVTSSGMTGIMMVMQMLIDAGDNAVIVGPVWPNARAAVEIMGGEPRTVALRFGNGGWALDVEEVMARCDDAHPRGLRQLAGQPDRLDDAARPARSAARGLPRARASGSLPTKSMPASSMTAAPRRPFSKSPSRTTCSSSSTASRNPGR